MDRYDLFSSLSHRRGDSHQTHRRRIEDVSKNCSLYLKNCYNSKLKNVEFPTKFPSTRENIEKVGLHTGAELIIEEPTSTCFDSTYHIASDQYSGDEFYEDSNESSDDEEQFVGEGFQNNKSESVRRNIREEILYWCLKYKIRNTALSELLKILQKFELDVPSDSRTLKHTQREVLTRPVDPGCYWHFGVKAMVDLLIENDIELPFNISVDVNIDGLPIYNSSKGALWPILGKFSEVKDMKPFVIGIYHHTDSKPKDVNAYLDDFILEMIEFEQDVYRGIKILPGQFIMDAPALALIKRIKQHNGSNSCPSCSIVGRYDGRMSFPEPNGVNRTDFSFRSRQDPLHHTTREGEIGPLERLDINMIINFGIDYLHVACLGLGKKLLSMLTGKLKFPKNNYQRNLFSQTNFQNIMTAIALCGITKPREIHRSIRQLSHLSFFKGTEFRTFILYHGIVVLKDNVDILIYKNYVYFHCAMTICISDKYRHFIPLAKELFQKFIEDFKAIYGSCMVSYNVHQLLHLTSVVERLGCLDNYSAFPFESKLGELKSSLCSGNKPLQQAANRTMEYLKLDVDNLKSKMNSEKKYPWMSTNSIFYKDFSIKNNERDCWILTNSFDIIQFLTPVKVTGQSIRFVGKKISRKSDYYMDPIPSSYLNVFCSNGDLDEQEEFSVDDIQCKLWGINSNNNTIIFFPLLHTYITSHN